VRVLRPRTSSLSVEECRALPLGSLIVWAGLAVYVRQPDRWFCAERDGAGSGWVGIDDLANSPYGVLIRIGPDWEVVEERAGDADAFAGSIAELMLNDPRLRTALRAKATEFADLADAVDRLDPRTR
jgi:hypothetical protein